MPAPYTGNPTAVQSPATAPAVNNPVVISIPAGTDLLSIESLVQEMKVTADNLTLLLNILGGTTTAKSLQADGAGGAAATVPVGGVQGQTVTATGAVSGATVTATAAVQGATVIPTTAIGGVATPTSAVTRGTVYKEAALFAAAIFDGATSTFGSGVNISSVSKSSTGVYVFNLVTAATSTARMCVSVTLGSISNLIANCTSFTTSSITVTVKSTAGTATDASVNLQLWHL